jgi:hypothetical protein
MRIPFWLRNLPHRARGIPQELLAAAGIGFTSKLYVTHIDRNGVRTQYGLVSRRVVTTIGAAFLVDCLQNLAEPETLNYHQSGTGNTAEATADTGLVAAVESRVAGTQSEPSSLVYRSQATLSYTGAATIVEHGIFWASSGANTLFDRSVFAGIPVNNGDSIQFTYELTVNAGG